jgi:hypothetical protein
MNSREYPAGERRVREPADTVAVPPVFFMV